MALLGRWMVRLLAAHEFFGAYRALPWLALGWALYGLYLVFVVIAGRARVTSRNFPAAAAGLAVNVALLVLLVPAQRRRPRHRRRRASRCAAPTWRCSLVMYLLTRSLFKVGFEWRRLAQLDGDPRGRRRLGRAAAADARRSRACCCAPRGWRSCRRCCCSRASSTRTSARRRARCSPTAGARVAAFRAGHGEVEAYAEDPLRDV